MDAIFDPSKDLLDVIIQVLIIVIPVIVTWFLRTYVKNSGAETEVALVVRLANAAIDFVEDLDKSGALELPPKVSKGAHKLQLAGRWLVDELQRVGIKTTEDQARDWITAEFRKRIGDVHMLGTTIEAARTAVDVVLGLERRGVLEIPADADRLVRTTELAADWLFAELARFGVSSSRDEATAWVRAEYLGRLAGEKREEPTDDPLLELAEHAVAFVEDLKAEGQLEPPPGTSLEQFEIDVAVAWAMAEAAKSGVVVSRSQVTSVVVDALGRRGDEPA